MFVKGLKIERKLFYSDRKSMIITMNGKHILTQILLSSPVASQEDLTFIAPCLLW